MISKEEFVNLIDKLKNSDSRISSAESQLGFEISASGAIAELWDTIYDMIYYLSNSKDKDGLYCDLARILYFPSSEKTIVEFYNKHFKEEENA